RGRRSWIVYLTAVATAGHLLALGLNLALFGWRPFAPLRALWPGLGELRSVFRFAVVGQLALPLLAAFALGGLRQVQPARLGRTAVALLALGGALENLCVTQPLVSVPRSGGGGWSAWLAAQPESTVIAHVPFPAGLHVSDYEADAW